MAARRESMVKKRGRGSSSIDLIGSDWERSGLPIVGYRTRWQRQTERHGRDVCSVAIVVQVTLSTDVGEIRVERWRSGMVWVWVVVRCRCSARVEKDGEGPEPQPNGGFRLEHGPAVGGQPEPTSLLHLLSAFHPEHGPLLLSGWRPRR